MYKQRQNWKTKSRTQKRAEPNITEPNRAKNVNEEYFEEKENKNLECTNETEAFKLRLDMRVIKM